MDQARIRDFRRGLRVLERQAELALISQTECCGVTPAQCHLLLEVEEADEASVGELATTLELDASTLSRTVDGLVRAGLLARREDPENRRRQLVALSAAGREKAAIINEACDRYYEGFLGTLPEAKLRILLKALPLLVGALRSWRLEGGSGGDSRNGGCCPDLASSRALKGISTKAVAR
jgi:DNA-binding MarR family transcriptional regulator